MCVELSFSCYIEFQTLRKEFQNQPGNAVKSLWASTWTLQPQWNQSVMKNVKIAFNWFSSRCTLEVLKVSFKTAFIMFHLADLGTVDHNRHCWLPFSHSSFCDGRPVNIFRMCTIPHILAKSTLWSSASNSTSCLSCVIIPDVVYWGEDNTLVRPVRGSSKNFPNSFPNFHSWKSFDSELGRWSK